MPVLTFDYTRKYNDLKGLQFSNEGYEEYSIGDMQERLQLLIDRSGVQLFNDAVIATTRSFVFPKLFYLNDNFWVVLRERNKKPYLIMHVSSVK